VSTPLGFSETAEALASGVVGRLGRRDVVVVDGPDAAVYLQGQVTQDLDGLAVGAGVDALVLSPQGKLEAMVRIARTGEERFAVEVESGFGTALLDRLRRFKVRVKATLDLVELGCLELRGPLADRPAVAEIDGDPGGDAVVLPYAFGALRGYDVLGSGAVVPPGVAIGDEGAFEVARILAGVPRMGRELTERTIPQEAGIVGRTVSFSKGCYTGQELVARLDARGNRVPWNLRLLRVPGAVDLSGGAPLRDADREVGHLTSAAYSPVLDATVALGYLRRDVAVPTTVTVDGPNGASSAVAEAVGE
jgi:folate-binding protein YgfZ